MSIDLAEMMADDLRTGPGEDIGVSVAFLASRKRGRQSFDVDNVPVSGIPLAESGKIDADFETWTAQVAVPVADCLYQPDIGQRVQIKTGPAAGKMCRVVRCTPDPTGGFYALELEPETSG